MNHIINESDNYRWTLIIKEIEEYLSRCRDTRKLAIPSIDQLIEQLEIIFGSYVVHGDYSNQPLSKLAYDILIELGIECDILAEEEE